MKIKFANITCDVVTLVSFAVYYCSSRFSIVGFVAIVVVIISIKQGS